MTPNSPRNIGCLGLTRHWGSSDPGPFRISPYICQFIIILAAIKTTGVAFLTMIVLIFTESYCISNIIVIINTKPIIRTSIIIFLMTTTIIAPIVNIMVVMPTLTILISLTNAIIVELLIITLSRVQIRITSLAAHECNLA